MKQDKEVVKNIWDEVAPNFGEIGPKYWSDFGSRLVELSNINKSARVLDIGMGRGASLFPTLNRIGKDGSIVGIDYSDVMVSKTQKDILSRNINNAEVKKILEQAGFKNIKVQEESSDVIYKNKEEWWQEMCTNAVRGIFNHIEKLGQDEFKKFRADIFNGLEEFNRGDGFHFNMTVIYAFGEK